MRGKLTELPGERRVTGTAFVNARVASALRA